MGLEFSTFHPSDDFLAGQSLAEFYDQSTGSALIDKAPTGDVSGVEEGWQDFAVFESGDVVGVALALSLLAMGRVLSPIDWIRSAEKPLI